MFCGDVLGKRLHRVEHIDPNLNQIGYGVIHRAATVENDFRFGPDVFSDGFDDLGGIRLDKLNVVIV